MSRLSTWDLEVKWCLGDFCYVTFGVDGTYARQCHACSEGVPIEGGSKEAWKAVVEHLRDVHPAIYAVGTDPGLPTAIRPYWAAEEKDA